jgi:hypothetical protein
MKGSALIGLVFIMCLALGVMFSADTANTATIIQPPGPTGPAGPQGPPGEITWALGNATYALIGHVHDLSAYATKAWSNSTYSLLGHTHDLSAYVTQTWGNATYALLGHTHSHTQDLRVTATDIKISTGWTYADTNKHTLDISAHVPSNCIMVEIRAVRTSGSGGYLRAWSGELANTGYAINIYNGYTATVPIAATTERIQLSNAVSNDTWDIYMFAYWTQD